MFGQQITGQAFPNQYGVVFYQSQGFGDRAFLFNVIQNVVSLVAVIITWFYIDKVGRRPALLFGGTMMAIFLFVLGGMGSVNQDNFNQHEKGLMVASLMLFQVFFNLSWAPWYVGLDASYETRKTLTSSSQLLRRCFRGRSSSGQRKDQPSRLRHLRPDDIRHVLHHSLPDQCEICQPRWQGRIYIRSHQHRHGRSHLLLHP